MSQSIRGRSAILFLQSTRKNTNVVEDVDILLLMNLVEFDSAVSEGKSRIAQPIRGRVAILSF